MEKIPLTMWAMFLDFLAQYWMFMALFGLIVWCYNALEDIENSETYDGDQ